MILLRIINIFLLASLCSISFGSKYIDINSRHSSLPDPIICKEGTSCVNFRFCKTAVKLLLHGNYEQWQSALKNRCEIKKGEGELMVCCPSKSNDDTISPRDCGQSYNFPTVHVSNDVQIGDFPWLVGIYDYQEPNVMGGPQCYGSLINSQYVLTTAHCMHKAFSTSRKMVVRLREHKSEPSAACARNPYGYLCPRPPIEIISLKLIRHPLYNPTSLINNIALIQLPEPLEISKDKRFDSIGPVCLPLERFTMPEMMSSLVAVGRSIQTISNSVTVLKFEAIMVNNSACGDLGLNIQPGQFCFKYLNLKKDQGQATAIMMTQDEFGRFVQVGFSSHGFNIFGPPEVATSISFYVDWIKSIIVG